jgi:hypothetical protein
LGVSGWVCRRSRRDTNRVPCPTAGGARMRAGGDLVNLEVSPFQLWNPRRVYVHLVQQCMPAFKPLTTGSLPTSWSFSGRKSGRHSSRTLPMGRWSVSLSSAIMRLASSFDAIVGSERSSGQRAMAASRTGMSPASTARTICSARSRTPFTGKARYSCLPGFPSSKMASQSNTSSRSTGETGTNLSIDWFAPSVSCSLRSHLCRNLSLSYAHRSVTSR